MKNMKNIWLILTFLLAWAFPKVHAENTVKILAIGNSFSEDAIEQNLHELADAEGIQTIVANLYPRMLARKTHAMRKRRPEGI